MEIIVPDYIDDDKLDSCGNTTVAVLSGNGLKILLCKECLDDLRKSINDYDNTIFCHKCKYFIMSEAGWNYGGSCLRDLSEEEREKFNPVNAGYSYCKDCFDTCKFSELKDTTS